MAIYPLYTFDAVVACDRCGDQLGRAGDAEILMLGDGNGNRRFGCKCGWHAWFDVTRSAAKAEEHMLAHAAHFALCRELNARTWPGNRKRVVEPPARPASPAPSAANVADFFDLGDMISSEVALLGN